LLAPGPQGTKPQFEIGDVLGEGGMGVVRTAQQFALRREVAVKTLKPDAGRGEAPQLLREARVTGVLEHPNVVPIYALGRDNEDRPLIVMRRIAGESWSSAIMEADDDARLTDAYLRKHLATLKQVAIATHYAHSKGIIHRDLKPENVMIGDYGEVYLVDWGIAVSLVDDTPGVLCARDITAIEGTPGYMAPEMAAADGSLIDERSDVYLLGAILHEIITGDPPHDGNNMRMILTAAFASVPHTYAPEVPRDLVAMCHRAMARFNEERYPSALAFADALDEFVTHRSSTLLSDEAAIRLRETQELLSVQSEERDSEKLYAKFSECRFAFTQALRSWPENEGAETGLQETLELMIEYELARDAPRAALALALDLPRQSKALRARVDAAILAKESARLRLEELERDKDWTVGAGSRRAIGLALASSYGVACVACGVLTRTGIFEVTHNIFAIVLLTMAAGTLVGAFARRASVLTTDFNRRLAVYATVVFAGYAGVWLYAGLAGISKVDATIFHSILGAVVWGTVGLTLNRLWLTIAFGAMVSIALVLAFPVYHWELLGIGGGLASMIVTYMSFAPPEKRRT
jgi:serine/threonine-protein kinase